VDYVATTPSVTGCEFVGRAYSKIIQGAVCTEVQGGFRQIYTGCAFCLTAVIIGWYFLLVPWVRVRNDGDQDEGFDKMGSINSADQDAASYGPTQGTVYSNTGAPPVYADSPRMI